MVIRLLQGDIQCSYCGKLMGNDEFYKVNEISFEIACLDCAKLEEFSKKNIVVCNTPFKQKLIDWIQKFSAEKRTLALNNDIFTIKELF